VKHYKDAKPGSDEFRREFQRIREEFVRRLERHVAGRAVSAFRACDADGKPFAWVWDNEKFKNAHTIGKIDDAKGFVRHMIDQGMCFAFMGLPTGEAIEVWLTTWEGSGRGPTWPSDCPRLFEEVHEGVFIGREGHERT